MMSLGWPLIQHDKCLNNKSKFGYRHQKMEGNVKTQRDDSHPKAKESSKILPSLIALRMKQPCQPLDLGLLAFRTMRK